MSPVEHLHSKDRILSVKEDNELLFKQFSQKPYCSHLLEAEPPPRNIKRSFLDYVDDIE